MVAAMPPSAIAACAALLAAVISLWCRPRWLWCAVLIVATGAGYFAAVLYGPAALWVALLAAAIWSYRRQGAVWVRAASLAAVVILTLSLAMHVLTGFDNPPCAQRRRRCRLEDYRVAADQRGRKLPGRDGARKVPWGDESDDA